MGNQEARFKREVESVVKKVLHKGSQTEWSNPDNYTDYTALREALKKAGVESCNLIVGFDYTNSNKTQGSRSYHGLCLHSLGDERGPNPYELALTIIGRALVPFFDDDGLIPAFVFGDIETKAQSIRQIGPTRGCQGVEGAGGILERYREDVGKALFSGPTSFAPLIDKAAELTRSSGNQLHVLLILADGQVSPGQCLAETTAAIVRASSCPLSIIMIGLGDGPWDDMVMFDDQIDQSKFDNFQFVRFEEFHDLLRTAPGPKSCEVVETAFTVCALQELPEQYAAMTKLGLLRHGAASTQAASLRDRSRSPRRP